MSGLLYVFMPPLARLEDYLALLAAVEATCAELGITAKKTRPYRPQTNGKIERFHRTLAEGWAFKKFYNSESARLAALPAWVHQYNHHRPHSAIGKRSPITRLDNLAGHHN